MPVQMIQVVGPVVADMLDPVVSVMVEAGYDRTISPGEPTPTNYLYSPDPTALANNLSIAIDTGLDNASEDMGMGRTRGTTRPDIGPGSTGQGAYGIGGPPVTMDSTPNEQVAASLQQERPQVTQQQPQQNVSDGLQLARALQPPGNSVSGDDSGGGTVPSDPRSVISRTFTPGGPTGQGGIAGRLGVLGANGANGFRGRDGSRGAGAMGGVSGDDADKGNSSPVATPAKRAQAQGAGLNWLIASLSKDASITRHGLAAAAIVSA
jgi:hypothetical protein